MDSGKDQMFELFDSNILDMYFVDDKIKQLILNKKEKLSRL